MGSATGRLTNKASEGPVELRHIVLYISRKKGFFSEVAQSMCPVGEFCAFKGANLFPGIEETMNKESVKLAKRVWMSKPVDVEMELVPGKYFRASLSHKGVLAIYSYADEGRIVQFTNLNTGKQVIVNVGGISLVAFYDDKAILLVDRLVLEEALVENVFKMPDMSVFKDIDGTEKCSPSAEVSSLHKRRVLYYLSESRYICSFNVDTRVNTYFYVKNHVTSIISFSGIDSGYKIIFNSYDGGSYRFRDDGATVYMTTAWGLPRNIFPSSRYPRDDDSALFVFERCLTIGSVHIDAPCPVSLKEQNSIIRIYKDVFLVYDNNTKRWVFVRITVL